MHIRMRIARLHDVVEHRPSAQLGQLLEVIEVVHRIGADQRHLDEALVAPAEHARQREAGFVGHQVGHHRRAVKVALHARGAVRIEALRGPSARAGVHRLVEQPANLARLLLGGRPRLGRFQTHHPRQQRRDRNVRQDVHRLGTAIDAVEKFGEGGPIPRHPGLHRGVRNRFDARHREHRALAALGMHRGEAEAAVADHDRRDAVPARDGAVRIPEQLRVVMGMQIDEAGRDDQSRGVDRLRGVGGAQPPDFRDAAVLDADVAAKARHPRSVHHHSIANDQIELRHGSTSVARLMRTISAPSSTSRTARRDCQMKVRAAIAWSVPGSSSTPTGTSTRTTML